MLRIGFLLDSYNLKRWQHQIFKDISDTPNIEISLMILNDGKYQSFGNRLNYIGYRGLQYIDRKVFKPIHNAFDTCSIQEEVESINEIKIKPIQLKFGIKFDDTDIEEIESYNLDVLIRFGFGIIRGKVLEAAKFGIWSLHHGDNQVNRGGPPGFWEVVDLEPVTGVTLQKLSENLDGGRVLRKAFVRTNNTSFYRNQNSVFWAGVELMSSALIDLESKGGKLQEFNIPDVSSRIQEESLFYSYPLYKDPNNSTAVKIFFSFWYRRLREAFKEWFNSPQWSLAYRYSVKNSFEGSIFRYLPLISSKGNEWADPFVIFEKNEYYVFVEELETAKKKAHLSYLKFDKKGQIISTEAVKIIEEDFHLSYPFVFQEKGEYYMIPEMAQSNQQWIYKAVDFPNKWEKYHQIFKADELYDPTLYFHQDTWYLFCTKKMNVGSSRDQYLCLYFADDLFSTDWKPHPCNPLTRDVRGARPAGKLFEWKNKLIRPGQIGAPFYGYGIKFHEIIILSRTDYQEVPLDEIVPEWSNKIRAVHTINFEKGFSVIDQQGTNS